jgi:hypothetical protein
MAARGRSIHAYWDPLRDPRACAEQLAASLPDLERLDQRFQMQLAVGSPSADERLSYTGATAQQILSDGWNATPTVRTGGFLSLGLWNGHEGPGEAGLQLICGAVGGNVALAGQCLIDLPVDVPESGQAVLAGQVMTWAVQAFDPAWAILADDEIREALDWHHRSPEVGPLTYVRGRVPPAEPFGTTIRPFARGYLLELDGWTPNASWDRYTSIVAAAQEHLRSGGYLPDASW